MHDVPTIKLCIQLLCPTKSLIVSNVMTFSYVYIGWSMILFLIWNQYPLGCCSCSSSSFFFFFLFIGKVCFKLLSFCFAIITNLDIFITLIIALRLSGMMISSLFLCWIIYSLKKKKLWVIYNWTFYHIIPTMLLVIQNQLALQGYQFEILLLVELIIINAMWFTRF